MVSQETNNLNKPNGSQVVTRIRPWPRGGVFTQQVQNHPVGYTCLLLYKVINQDLYIVVHIYNTAHYENNSIDY